jgi:hypothetical protein
MSVDQNDINIIIDNDYETYDYLTLHLKQRVDKLQKIHHIVLNKIEDSVRQSMYEKHQLEIELENEKSSYRFDRPEVTSSDMNYITNIEKMNVCLNHKVKRDYMCIKNHIECLNKLKFQESLRVKYIIYAIKAGLVDCIDQLFDINIEDENMITNLMCNDELGRLICTCNKLHQHYLLYEINDGKGYFVDTGCDKYENYSNDCRGHWTGEQRDGGICGCKVDSGNNAENRMWVWNAYSFDPNDVKRFNIESAVPYGFVEHYA